MKRIGIINRGEPAIRFLNALDALRREEDAPESVALYTDADLHSVYVRSADRAVRIGEGRAAYLDSDAVIKGLEETECDAAWLGWGFASEDGDFCQALEDAGITLLAPRPEVMTELGDKIRAKQLAEKYEVPVAPWAIVTDPHKALAEAERIGLPLLLKAAGGGGGRGIRLVEDLNDFVSLFESARDEAARSFRSEGSSWKKFVKKARHIEVQVLGDGEGVQLRFLVCEIARFRDGARRSSKRHQRLIYPKRSFIRSRRLRRDSHQLSGIGVPAL